MPDSTLTLADIRQREFPARSLGVLGDPIAHSLSPTMHNAAIAAGSAQHPELKGLNYYRLHIKPDELAEALNVLKAKGFIGLNLTVPHKIAALKLVSNLSTEARAAESVNTLTLTPQGWAGDTTDGQGFIAAYEEKSGEKIAGKEVILLGAGGAARAVAVACLNAQCQSLFITNRDATKAQALVAALKDPRAQCGELKSVGSKAVIINCTTLGLSPTDESPLAEKFLQSGQFVFDTTYGSHQSKLLQLAQAHGVAHCDGRPMLRWQGAVAFKLWTGITPPAAPMRQAIGEK